MGDIYADRGSAVSTATSRHGNATAQAATRGGNSFAMSTTGAGSENRWTITNKLSLASLALGSLTFVMACLSVFGDSASQRFLGTLLLVVVLVLLVLSLQVDLRYRTTGPQLDLVAKLSRRRRLPAWNSK